MPTKWDQFSREELIRQLEAAHVGRTADAGADAEQLLHDLQVQQRELEMRLRELADSRRLLEDSRTRYAQLYDLAPIAYCTLDRSGVIEDCNLALAAFAGVERGQLVGTPLSALVHDDDEPMLTRHVQSCFDEKRRVTTELRLKLKQLGTVPFQLVSTALVSDAGKVEGCRTALTDVSAVKRSEERLGMLAGTSVLLSASFDVASNLAAVVRSLVPSMADLCFADLLDASGNVHRVEVAVADPKKRALVEALRTPPRKWEAPSKPVLISADGRTLAAVLPDRPEERRRAMHDLTVRAMMVVPLVVREKAIGSLSLFMLESGRAYTPSDLAFASDVASRGAIAVDNARLYAESQRAIRLRQDLLAVVSHDLRSPLTGILLSVGTLLDAAPANERRRGRRQLERIKRAVAQMRHMVEDLLDMVSLEKGHLSIDRHDHSIGTLVDEAFDLLEPIAQDHGIALVAEPADGLWVKCDRERVLQVLSNLLGNALKFTPRGGRVMVSCSPAGELVRVRVHDTGPGITPSRLKTLFERNRPEIDSGSKARGLGLFICKGIVEAHGGSIWAESREGDGTALTFTLPAALTPEVGNVVMIVEDEAGIRELLGELLRAHGYEVVPAANGREALDLLESGRARPRMILLDLNLPVMDGREMVRAMKAQPKLASIPVLLLSSADRLEDEARKLGAQGALKKPIDVPAMLTAIAQARGPAHA